MEVNVGTIDRAIRLVIAAVLIGVGLGVVRGPRGIAMAAVGAEGRPDSPEMRGTGMPPSFPLV